MAVDRLVSGVRVSTSFKKILRRVGCLRSGGYIVDGEGNCPDEWNDRRNVLHVISFHLRKLAGHYCYTDICRKTLRRSILSTETF